MAKKSRKSGMRRSQHMQPKILDTITAAIEDRVQGLGRRRSLGAIPEAPARVAGVEQGPERRRGHG